MGLALVVIEEHAGAAVHLRDDDPLGAVDDEGAVLGHQRHVAHVDILLLDVADRARPGILVDVPDDQAQGDLQGCGKGDAALLALIDIVFRRLEFVAHEFELRALGEIPDRKDRSEDLLQADIGALFGAFAHLQKVIVGALLDLDQVRHRRDLGDATKAPADALLAAQGYCHAAPRYGPAAPASPRVDPISPRPGQLEPRHRSASPTAIRPPRRRPTLFQSRSRPSGLAPAPALHPADAKNRRARRTAPRFQVSGVERGSLPSAAGPRR